MTVILILRPNAVNKKANLNIQPRLCRHSHSAVLNAQTSLRNCFILRLHEYLINQLTSKFSILIYTALQWLVPFIYLAPHTHGLWSIYHNGVYIVRCQSSANDRRGSVTSCSHCCGGSANYSAFAFNSRGLEI